MQGPLPWRPLACRAGRLSFLCLADTVWRCQTLGVLRGVRALLQPAALVRGTVRDASGAPAVNAVVQFLENGGKEALITNPENIERAVAGETGTRIRP